MIDEEIPRAVLAAPVDFHAVVTNLELREQPVELIAERLAEALLTGPRGECVLDRREAASAQ